MGRIRQAVAGIGLISFIGMLAGCAEVLVPGTIAGAGEYYRYTTTNVARQTLMGNVAQVTAAAQNALKKMDIRLYELNPGDTDTEMTASTDELDITITMKAITAFTTKVTVDAVKDHVVKDKATAAEILSQIQVELDHSSSQAEAFPKVFIRNECRRTIDVIVYYLAGKNEPQTWQTRGWFSVDPGQVKYVADTNNRYIYFYGETRSENKRVWSGEMLQWFEGKPYGFFKVDMGRSLANYTHSFHCD